MDVSCLRLQAKTTNALEQISERISLENIGGAKEAGGEIEINNEELLKR